MGGRSMMTIYNSEEEVALRALLILSVSDRLLNAETVAQIDFLSVYGKEFGLYRKNLNGDNPFMYSETALRNQRISEALQNLSWRGLIEIKLSGKNGFLYRTTETGKTFTEGLESEYSVEFRECANSAYAYVMMVGTKTIQDEIEKKAMERIRRTDGV